MFKFKQSLAACAGMALLIGLISLVTPRTTQSQGGPPSREVKVINTPAEPVPVTGTVSIGNLGDSPLPVRDVDSPARQPISVSAEIILSGSATTTTLYTVPAGKRLVLEDASAFFRVPVGQRVRIRLLKVDSNSSPVGLRSLTVAYQLTRSSLDEDVLEAGETMRMYIDAGEILQAFVERSSTTSSAVGSLSVYGHLVDVP